MLAKFLKKAREDAGLTQWQLAKKMGYATPQQISNQDRGLCPMPLKSAKKFCKLTRTNPEKLKQLLIDQYSQKVSKALGL